MRKGSEVTTKSPIAVLPLLVLRILLLALLPSPVKCTLASQSRDRFTGRLSLPKVGPSNKDGKYLARYQNISQRNRRALAKLALKRPPFTAAIIEFLGRNGGFRDCEYYSRELLLYPTYAGRRFEFARAFTEAYPLPQSGSAPQSDSSPAVAPWVAIISHNRLRRIRLRTTVDVQAFFLALLDAEYDMFQMLTSPRGALIPRTPRSVLLDHFWQGKRFNPFFVEALYCHKRRDVPGTVALLAKALALNVNKFSDSGDLVDLEHSRHWNLSFSMDEDDPVVTLYIGIPRQRIDIEIAPGKEGRAILAVVFWEIVSAYDAEVRRSACWLSRNERRNAQSRRKRECASDAEEIAARQKRRRIEKKKPSATQYATRNAFSQACQKPTSASTVPNPVTTEASNKQDVKLTVTSTKPTVITAFGWTGVTLARVVPSPVSPSSPAHAILPSAGASWVTSPGTPSHLPSFDRSRHEQVKDALQDLRTALADQRRCPPFSKRIRECSGEAFSIGTAENETVFVSDYDSDTEAGSEADVGAELTKTGLAQRNTRLSLPAQEEEEEAGEVIEVSLDDIE